MSVFILISFRTQCNTTAIVTKFNKRRILLPLPSLELAPPLSTSSPPGLLNSPCRWDWGCRYACGWEWLWWWLWWWWLGCLVDEELRLLLREDEVDEWLLLVEVELFTWLLWWCWLLLLLELVLTAAGLLLFPPRTGSFWKQKKKHVRIGKSRMLLYWIITYTFVPPITKFRNAI